MTCKCRTTGGASPNVVAHQADQDSQAAPLLVVAQPAAPPAPATSTACPPGQVWDGYRCARPPGAVAAHEARPPKPGIPRGGAVDPGQPPEEAPPSATDPTAPEAPPFPWLILALSVGGVFLFAGKRRR